MNPSKQRVMDALMFRQPDRLPRFWNHFWPEFVEQWREAGNSGDIYAHFGEDMTVVAANETPWPSRRQVIRREADAMVIRTGWGELKRVASGGGHMGQLLEPGLPERVDPDTLVFEDPFMDERFAPCDAEAAAMKACRFTWCKSGGPYLRSAFMRGEETFWIDVIDDPQWARAFVDRVTDHIIAVAVTALKRWGLQDTGMEINDDVAAGWGPFVGPEIYERIFLPALRRMVKAYKAAGARWVMHHADGNVMPLLDMWVDAGIDAINPVEFRSGMDPVKIKAQYGRKLVCIGGLDNAAILPRGDRGEIRDHIQHLTSAGHGGGYIIGPHSIGPDVSLDTMHYVLELLDADRAPVA